MSLGTIESLRYESGSIVVSINFAPTPTHHFFHSSRSLASCHDQILPFLEVPMVTRDVPSKPSPKTCVFSFPYVWEDSKYASMSEPVYIMNLTDRRRRSFMPILRRSNRLIPCSTLKASGPLISSASSPPTPLASSS